MFESKRRPILPPEAYHRRLRRHAQVGLGILVTSVTVGMVGFHLTEGMGWLDSFLESAMLVGGMGPVGTINTPAGKLFAGVFAIYSGVTLLVVAVYALSPIYHRFLHLFHADEKD